MRDSLCGSGHVSIVGHDTAGRPIASLFYRPGRAVWASFAAPKYSAKVASKRS